MKTEEEIRKKIAEFEKNNEWLMKQILENGFSVGALICYAKKNLNKIKLRALRWVLGEGELT